MHDARLGRPVKRWPTPDWAYLSWHYRALHILAQPWHNPLFVRAKGIENVPREGGFVFAANHTSWWDPIILGASIGRPVNFLGKREVFKGRFTRWFFGGGGVIPVDRNSRNPDALKQALDALRQGRVIGVFPEGTRHVGKLGPARPGAARLALQSGCPVVPAGILSDRFWGPGTKVPHVTEKVRIHVGRPIRLAGDPEDPDAWRKGTEQVMGAIDALLNEAWLARERGETWSAP